MKITRYFLASAVILFTIFSCKNTSNLSTTFNCKTSNFSNLEKIADIKKQFRLNIPKNWNTRLYYDDIQTQIYTADTTKQLSQTYILDVAFNSGELILDNAFKNKILSNLKQNEQLENLKFQFDTFHKKPSIWFLSKGKKSNLSYHFFQLFILNSPTDYYEITTKIYGDEFVEDRLCESISLMDEIEFLK
jgi:hypothetical protein